MEKPEKQKDQIIYDWVSITSRIHSPQNFIDLLGLNRGGVVWQNLPGNKGYRDKMSCNGIHINYNGREDMGVWLEMTGQGCRMFEEHGNGDYEALFEEVRQEPKDVHFTRLDVAFDDHSGLLDIEQIELDTRALELVCRCKEIGSRWSFDFMTGTRGLDMDYGRKGSKVLIRIYDKAAERGYSDGRHWVRVELQMRDDRCMAFLEAPGTIGERYSGVLMNYLRFVEEPQHTSGERYDTNRWRWEVKDYWDKFLNSAHAIRLYRKPGLEYNRHKLQDFVYKQCGNAIAAEIICCGGMEPFMKAVMKDIPQLPMKYQAVIRQAKLAARIAELQKGK